MKKNKSLLLYIALLFVVSIVIGIIYGINNPYDLSNYISNLSKNNNLYITHMIIMSIFLFSTLSYLGLIAHSIYFAFEGISIGYLISIFFANYKLNGLFYCLINILLNKGLFIICLIYLFIIGYHYLKKGINNIIGNNKDYLILLIKPLLQKFGILTAIIFVYDTIIYFFGNMFLKYLTFML